MQAKDFLLKSSTFLRVNSRSVRPLQDGGEQFNPNDASIIECDKWGNRKGFAPNGWNIASGTVRPV
ncbi:hypothetical protein [Cupriavidus pauculus]